jgi:hypothetical protein
MGPFRWLDKIQFLPNQMLPFSKTFLPVTLKFDIVFITYFSWVVMIFRKFEFVNSEISWFFNSDRAQISAKSAGLYRPNVGDWIGWFGGLTNDGLYPLVWPNKYTGPSCRIHLPLRLFHRGQGNRLGIEDRNQIPLGVGDEPYLYLEESQIDR